MNKKLCIFLAAITVIMVFAGCDRKINQNQDIDKRASSSGVDNQVSAIEDNSSIVSEKLELQGYRYEASDGKSIIFRGTHWIDENRILICEGEEPINVSIIDITSGETEFTYSWNLSERSLLSLTFGLCDNTVVLSSNENILTISCDSYSASGSINDNYIEFTSKRASSGWDAVQQGVCKPGIPVTLVNTQMGKEIQAFAPDGKAYWLTAYAGWSPNGEYLLVSPDDGEENDLSGLDGPYEGKFAVIDTSGNTLFTFILPQGVGRNPQIMWTANNTLVVYRIDTDAGKMTVQEFFPDTKSKTEEALVEGCDHDETNVKGNDRVVGSGKNISLLYTKNGIIAYNRKTGERTNISVPVTYHIRLSPNDRNLLVETDDAVWIKELE